MSKPVQKKANGGGGVLNEPSPTCHIAADADIDLLLLKDSLTKTPWERMLANDDALNFADSLQTAMKKRHAKISVN